MAFNLTSKVSRVQIDNSTNVPFTPAPSLQNNTYLYGNRRDLVTTNLVGDTTTSSATILNVTNITTLKIGYTITGTGIASNSVIIAITGTQITLNNAATATATSVALIANEVSLPIPVPQAGFPLFNYYQIYQLPTNLITDSASLLAYFSNCGYEVNYGYSGSQVLNNIGAFSPNPPVSGQCTLYFAGQALNVGNIANSLVTGTFSVSGTSISGTIVSISTGSYTPQITADFTGNTTSASASITNLNINANLLMIGSSITGTGIPTGATIATIVSSTAITISIAATATATAVSLAYTSLSTLSADTQIVVNSTNYTGLQLGENLTLNFVQQSSNPDVNNTEPFIMNLWQSAMAMQNLNGLNINATVGAPAVYFSILPNAASTNFFGPNGSTMPLGISPSVVATSSTTITLSLPLPFNYASFVPSITLGSSSITQAVTGATGTIFQSTVNGTVLQVQLQNVTGTFNTTNLLSLLLDNTITIMSLQQKYFATQQISLRTLPCIYPINSNNDITSTYAALFQYAVNNNQPTTANNGQGNCSVVFGNQTIPTNLAVSQLPNNINNQYYDPVYVPFVQRAGVVYRSTAQTMCAMATVMACNNYPFNPLNDILIDGFSNSPYPEDWIDMSIGGVADQIINLGYMVIASNSNNQQYLFLGRTGQTTINNVPDNEFYPSYVLDTSDYIRRAEILICRNNGVGQVRQTSTTLQAISLDIVSLMTTMGNDGILANVNTNNNLISVTRNPNNPLGVSIYNPIQQIPGFTSAYATIVNYSINFTL